MCPRNTILVRIQQNEENNPIEHYEPAVFELKKEGDITGCYYMDNHDHITFFPLTQVEWFFCTKKELTEEEREQAVFDKFCNYCNKNNLSLPTHIVGSYFRKNGKNLCLIPSNLLTRDLSMEAIQENPGNIRYLPSRSGSEGWFKDICLTALKKNETLLSYLILVYPQLLEKSHHLTAVKKDGLSLKYIPHKLKDYELCFTAIKQHGSALRFVPEELRDHALCLEAIKRDGVALAYVPDLVKSYTLCLKAVRQNGCAFDHVPHQLQNYELYFNSLKHPEFVFIGIPESIDGPLSDKERAELYKTALRTDALAFLYMNDDILNKHLDDGELILMMQTHEFYQTICSEQDNYPLLWKRVDELHDIFLKQVNTLVIFDELDSEIKQSCRLFASREPYEGKTIIVSKGDSWELLTELTNINPDRSIRLVLNGHSSVSEAELAGFSMEECAALLTEFPAISSLSLSGCCTAALVTPDSEEKMILKFQQQVNHWIKENSGKNQSDYINYLTSSGVLEKGHKEYKHYKEFIPFISSIRITEEEALKQLQNSLLLKLIQAIKKEVGLRERKIEVKAVPTILFVNLHENKKKRGFIRGPSGGGPLYTDGSFVSIDPVRHKHATKKFLKEMLFFAQQKINDHDFYYCVSKLSHKAPSSVNKKVSLYNKCVYFLQTKPEGQEKLFYVLPKRNPQRVELTNENKEKLQALLSVLSTSINTTRSQWLTSTDKRIDNAVKALLSDLKNPYFEKNKPLSLAKSIKLTINDD